MKKLLIILGSMIILMFCVLLGFLNQINKIRCETKSSDIVIPEDCESNSYNNFVNGGKIAYLNGDIYYIDERSFVGGVRKVRDGVDSYITKKCDAIYSYEEYLFCVSNDNIYSFNTKTQEYIKVVKNLFRNQFIPCNNKLYYLKYLGVKQAPVLCSSDLNGKNETKIAENVNDLFVFKDKVYCLLEEENSVDLIYSLMCVDNTKMTKVADSLRHANVNMYTLALTDGVYFESGGFYDMNKKEFKDIGEALYSDSEEYNIYYRNSIYNTIITSVYFGNIDDFHGGRIEGNNEKPEAGIWKFDVDKKTQKKISGDYMIQYFALFNDEDIFAIKDGKLIQFKQ